VPEIKRAQREIHRVLRPGGELVVMLYSRWSLNYLVSIGVVRRAALVAAYPLSRLGLLGEHGVLGKHWVGGMLGGHLANARRMGLVRYLRLREFTHYNTDGPANPYALVYDRKKIERDFPSFKITRTYKRFMHAPPLPVHGLPGGKLLGWHLWAHLEPQGKKPGGSGSPAADGNPVISEGAES
jgi:SAM-dependent methyltransferase